MATNQASRVASNFSTMKENVNFYRFSLIHRKGKSRTICFAQTGETTWFLKTNILHDCLDSVVIIRNGVLKGVNLALVLKDGFSGPKKFKKYLQKEHKSIRISMNNPYRVQCGRLTGTVIIINNSAVTDSISKNALLSDEYLRLFDKGNFSDFTLKCGSDSIPVHKCILAARSPYFAAMFRTPMRENHDGVLPIDDMEPDPLRAMLQYVYSGKLNDVTDELAEKLLLGAEKYQLEELKLFCLKKLMAILNSSNVFRFLILGDLLDRNLKTTALTFIKQNFQFSQLEKTEEWKSFQEEHTALACEVLMYVVKYVQDTYIYVI